MNESFDVIVVGGGPAGLSVASRLAHSHRVLVIEKNQAGQTQRSWFVPPTVLNDESRAYTYGGVTRFLANTCSGAKTQWVAKLFHPNAYPYVEEHEILPHWVRTIREHGSEVMSGCAYQDHRVDAEGVTVVTSQGEFRAKVMVDASGYDSPIVKKYQARPKNMYWWSVYGAIGRHPDGLGGMEVGDYMMWQTFKDEAPYTDASLQQGRPVFEYEVQTEDRSFSLILYLRKEIMPKEEMEKVFEHVIRNEASTAQFRNMEIIERKWGWYPSGGVSQEIAWDRIIAIGDAACWTTPCGWGMSFILANYANFAKELSERIRQNRLDAASLKELPRFGLTQHRQILLNVLMTHFLANAPAHLLDRFIDLFNKDLDPIYCEKVFTLNMSIGDTEYTLRAILKDFSLFELAGILRPEDYKTLVEEVALFLIEDVLETLRRWLGLPNRPVAFPPADPGQPITGFSFDTEPDPGPVKKAILRLVKFLLTSFFLLIPILKKLLQWLKLA